jgi:methionine-rich copper-binding protein CopC
LVGAMALLVTPLGARAHSELKTALPADGSTVVGTPDEIVLTFTDHLNPTKSSIILLDGSGTQVAKAGPDPANDSVMRLTPPTLGAGAYEIDWTSVALDGDLLRGKVTFTVTAPTPSPTVEPTAAPSATPVASAPPSQTPSPSPSPVASPAPVPTSASSADVLIPVVVAILLIAGLGAWLARGRMGRGAR